MLDQPLRDQLIREHLGLVRALARKLRDAYNLRVEMDELVGYGSAGLVDAANRWDPERGVAFSTFVHYRVRGAILDWLRQQGLFTKHQLLRFAAGADAVLQERAEQPAGQEAAAGGIESLAGTLREIAAVFVLSLDDPDQARKLADTRQADAHQRLAVAQERNQVRRALSRLPGQERELLRLHYWEDQTLSEAGKQLGLSRSWACRLHARAISRLARLLPQQE